MVWVTRVHPRDHGTLNLFVNGMPVGTRVVPRIPGQWFEIDSFIPGKLIPGTKTVVRVEAHLNDPNAGHHMPYYHWFYQGQYISLLDSAPPPYRATFGQSILLVGHTLDYNADMHRLWVNLAWQLDEAKVTAGGGSGVAEGLLCL